MSVEALRNRQSDERELTDEGITPGPSTAENRLSARLLRKYSDNGSEQTERESDEVEDCGCFGWLRGIRDRAFMLELRKRDGNIVAVGYAWIERMEFDPSDGIRLYLGGKAVRIQGKNLNTEARTGVRLFEGLTRHRVPWIRENHAQMRGESEHHGVELITF